MWSNTRKNSTTSAYSSTNPPAQPGCSSSSHPTNIRCNPSSRALGSGYIKILRSPRWITITLVATGIASLLEMEAKEAPAEDNGSSVDGSGHGRRSIAPALRERVKNGRLMAGFTRHGQFGRSISAQRRRVSPISGLHFTERQYSSVSTPRLGRCVRSEFLLFGDHLRLRLRLPPS